MSDAYWNKHLKLAQRCRADLCRIFREAREKQNLTHGQILDAKSAVMRRAYDAKAPRWLTSELLGYCQAQMDILDQEFTIHVYEDRDGELYAVSCGHFGNVEGFRRTEEFYAAGKGPELSRLPGFSVWRNTKALYFQTEETAALRAQKVNV